MGTSSSAVLLTEFSISCFFQIKPLRPACPLSSYLIQRLKLFPMWPFTPIWPSQLYLHFLTKTTAYLTYDICQAFLPSWALLRRCRKSTWHEEHYHEKIPTKLSIEGMYVNVLKTIHDMPPANITFSGKKKKNKNKKNKNLSFKTRNKTRMSAFTTSIQHSPESPSYNK